MRVWLYITKHRIRGGKKSLLCSWYRYLKNNISVTLCLIEGELFSIPDAIPLESTGTKLTFVRGYRIVIWEVSFFCLLTSLERASPPLRPHTKRKGMVERMQAIFLEGLRMPQRQVGCVGGRETVWHMKRGEDIQSMWHETTLWNQKPLGIE